MKHNALPPRFAFIGALAASAAAWAVPIAELAPRNALAVVGVDDFTSFYDAFERTGFHDVWQAEETRAWLRELMGGSLEQMRETLLEQGFDIERTEPPTGAAGVALWAAPPEDNRSDYRLEAQVLASAEFDPEALADMTDMLLDALERADDRGEIELTDHEFGGVTIYSVRSLAAEEDDPDDMEDAEWDDAPADDEWNEDEWAEDWEDEDWEGLDGGAFGDLRPPFDAGLMHIAWTEDHVLVASAPPALEAALDRLAGRDIDSAADSSAMRASKDMLGPHHVSAVLSTEAFFTMMKATGDEEEETFDARLDALGFAEVGGASLGLRFDTPDAMAEITAAALAPRKEGAVALFRPGVPMMPPAFIPADAFKLWLFSFDFQNLPGLLRQLAPLMGSQEEREFQQQMLDQLIAQVGPVLETLGPECVVWSVLERPFSITSEKQVFALRAPDERAVSAGLMQLAPFIGLQPRDFQGGQVWSAPLLADVALGVGAGYVFTGPVASVESALRLAFGAEAPRLADEDRYKETLRPFAEDGVAYAFSDTGAQFEYLAWLSENWERIMREELEEQFRQFDPGFDDEMIDNMVKQAVNPFRGAPLHLMQRTMGDVGAEVQWTPEGIVFRSLMRRP